MKGKRRGREGGREGGGRGDQIGEGIERQEAMQGNLRDTGVRYRYRWDSVCVGGGIVI